MAVHVISLQADSGLALVIAIKKETISPTHSDEESPNSAVQSAEILIVIVAGASTLRMMTKPSTFIGTSNTLLAPGLRMQLHMQQQELFRSHYNFGFTEYRSQTGTRLLRKPDRCPGSLDLCWVPCFASFIRRP